MKLLILKTNIKTQKTLEKIAHLFNAHPFIQKWSVDIEDIDKVLRIEAISSIDENEILGLMLPYGLRCEPLKE